MFTNDEQHRLSRIQEITEDMHYWDAILLLTSAICGIYVACNPACTTDEIGKLHDRIGSRLIFIAALLRKGKKAGAV